jgi:hypothetical protein
MVAAEANTSSGAELRCGLIVGNVRLRTKAAVLHFKNKELVSIPEVLDLDNI